MKQLQPRIKILALLEMKQPLLMKMLILLAIIPMLMQQPPPKAKLTMVYLVTATFAVQQSLTQWLTAHESCIVL
jgi:hypothetical protein